MAENEDRLPNFLLVVTLPEHTPVAGELATLTLTQLAPHCPFPGLIGAM